MTTYEDVLTALKRTIWGYIFLCFNVNLTTGAGIFNFLPTFIGYLLFISVVNLLENSIEEVALLKVPLIILTVWFIADDILSIAGVGAYTFVPIIGLVVDILNMYFNFQFLTNLAYLAKRCQYDGCTFDKQLKFFRSVQTIFLTINAIFKVFTRFVDLSSSVYIYVNIALAVVALINSICIIITLIRLKRNLIKPEEIPIMPPPLSGTLPTAEGDVPPVAPSIDFNETSQAQEVTKPLTDIE